MSMTPRVYLSYSQLALFERGPEHYAQEYLYGHEKRLSRNIVYGSKLAEGLENGEATGDPVLDLMMAKLPKFERMDLPVEANKGVEIMWRRKGKEQKVVVPALQDGKELIPLLALPDTAKRGFDAFKEYKTSTRKWTQKMADESGQITFYTTAMWLATGKIPPDIELVCVPTEYDEEGRLRPTGELVRLNTRRTMTDIIKMTGRMRKAWAGIKQLCESELL